MRLFFYGTLIAGQDNPVATTAHNRLRDLGPATACGRLYAIDDPQGWYPALLPGEGTVHGWLYETTASFGAPDLARLDAYEDFDPSDSAGSLYVREEITVTAGAAPIDAQAYRFNQPLPAGARTIPDGDFAAWIAREQLRPYGAVS